MQTETDALLQNERDAKICARHVAGESYEAIGQSIGLSGERVRQIVMTAQRKAARNKRLFRLRNAFLRRP